MSGIHHRGPGARMPLAPAATCPPPTTCKQLCTGGKYKQPAEFGLLLGVFVWNRHAPGWGGGGPKQIEMLLFAPGYVIPAWPYQVLTLQVQLDGWNAEVLATGRKQGESARKSIG